MEREISNFRERERGEKNGFQANSRPMDVHTLAVTDILKPINVNPVK
jgi:hypothetical protein